MLDGFPLNCFSVFSSFSQTASSEEDNEEWRPPDLKQKAPSKLVGDPSTGKSKAPAKRIAKTKEPKQPKAPKLPRDPKPRVPRKSGADGNTQASKVLIGSGLAGPKRKKDIVQEIESKETDCPKGEMVEERVPNIQMKEEVGHNCNQSIPFSIGLLDMRKSCNNAISVLNIGRVINTKLLNN